MSITTNIGPCDCCGNDCCCNLGANSALVATITEVSDCECGDGVSIDLSQTSWCGNVIASVWTGSGAFCGRTLTLTVTCFGEGVWALDYSFDDMCGADTGISADSVVCNPLSLCFNDILFGPCCGEEGISDVPTINICVTE